MSKALIFDTETTDATEPQIIEAAYMELFHPFDSNPIYCERFKPSKEITLGAMATHHIIMADLTGCRFSTEFKLPAVEYLIGHNVDFDWQAAGAPCVKRICTLALSRYLFPEIDSHSQSAMMYHLFPDEEAQNWCKGAHNAAADVMMCHELLKALVDEMESREIPCEGWEEIWQASEVARIPTVMTFGMHKGKLLKNVPSSYIKWLLGQPDVDPYLRQALTA